MASNPLAYGVSKKIPSKKQKLPIPLKMEVRPIIKLKLSWRDNPGINVRVMHNPGANVAVLSQSLVGENKFLVVLRERAEIITGYDGDES